MKQFHIVQSISVDYGGIGHAALRYAESLSSAEVHIYLYVISSSAQEWELGSSKENFTLLRSERLNLLLLFSYILKERIDIIHIHGIWSPLYAFIIFWAYRKKLHIIISPHGCLQPWALKHRSWKKKLALQIYQKRAIDAASMILATADSECESIRALNYKGPIAIIPNGVNDYSLKPRVHCNNTKVLLFLSRIHPVKGVLDLVDAWAKVRRPDWRVVIAGPSDLHYLAKVHKRIAELGLEADFSFPGLVIGFEKQRLFAEADLFVLPTYSENFGIVIAEALSNGIPVITTTGAPWSELLTHNCGWWVDPGASNIANAINSAMNLSPAELSQMGLSAIELIKRNYSWPKIGEQGREVCEWLLDNNAKLMPIVVKYL